MPLLGCLLKPALLSPILSEVLFGYQDPLQLCPSSEKILHSTSSVSSLLIHVSTYSILAYAPTLQLKLLLARSPKASCRCLSKTFLSSSHPTAQHLPYSSVGIHASHPPGLTPASLAFFSVPFAPLLNVGMLQGWSLALFISSLSPFTIDDFIQSCGFKYHLFEDHFKMIHLTLIFLQAPDLSIQLLFNILIQMLTELLSFTQRDKKSR